MKRQILFLFNCFIFISVSAQNDFTPKIIEEDNTDLAKGNFHVDFDNDGDTDLIGAATGSGAFLLFENDGFGSFLTHVIDDSDQFSRGAYAVASEDLDGDGDLDIAGIITDGGFREAKVVWFENQGNFDFTPHLIRTLPYNSPYVYSAISLVDLNTDGDIDILTASAIENSFNYYENDGNGSFTNFVINNDSEYANRASDVDFVDIDNDGDIDVIGTLYRSPKYLWFENDGNENFTPHVIEDTYLLIDGALSIDAGDVDNDGDIDLVGASSNARRFLWFENDGAQNFTTKLIEDDNDYSTNANKVQLNDIDNDGDLDVIGSSNHSISTGLYWFENVGNENPSNIFRDSFDNSTVSIISNGGGVSSKANREVGVADFDGDGNLDVYASSNSTFHWFKNDGTSSSFSENFISLSFLAQGSTSIEGGDLDGDGDIDFASSSGAMFIWHENVGNDMFKTHIIDNSVIYTAGAKSIQIIDLDDDGDLDILGAANTARFPGNSYNGAYVWYNNDGLGNFEFNLIDNSYAYSRSANSITVEDFDGDGDNDVVAASETPADMFVLFRNNGAEVFTPEEILSPSEDIGDAYYVKKNDLDKDGDYDILATSRDNDTFFWLKNDGVGNFSAIVIDNSITNSNGAEIIDGSDLDMDGDIDIVVSAIFSKKIGWYENDGNENFNYKNIEIPNEFPMYFKIGNLDNKSGPDLILASDSGYWQFINDGTGFFRRSVIEKNSDNFASNQFSLVDYNFDGLIDIVGGSVQCCSPKETALKVYENLGTKNEIQGKVSLDIDSNGCDNQDLILKNVMVTAANEMGTKSTFTDDTGFYSVLVGTGNFTTTVSSNLPSYFSPTPNASTSTFGNLGNIENIDFCFDANQPANDLSITVVPTSEVRPGFGAKYELVFKNEGTSDISGSISFEYDDRLNFYNSSEASSSHLNNVISFDFDAIKPFESRKINLAFTVPLLNNINLGDILEFTATINPVVGDYTETNNVFNLEQTVIGSYDPNDITVLEGEEVNIDNVADYLNYVIRFQNTGTASAINVRIDHELDADLDWETFTPISSSHANTTTITDGKDVEFLFENIHLPDSTSNEPASHGHVAFKIKPKSDIVVGDVVQGTASIYFDFNPAIITNTVNTEFVDDTESLISTAFVVSPISCSGANDAVIQVEANGGTEPYLYELRDGNSVVLISEQANNTFVDIGPGNYITRVVDNDGEESFFDITIQEPMPIETTFEAANVTCFGANNGQIEVIATNGTAPYNYGINGGAYQASNLFVNLSPGQYTVETVDNNGCNVVSAPLIIAEPTILTATTTVSEVSCKGLNDGSIVVTASGGTSPYEYSLDGTSYSTNNEFNDLVKGNYVIWSRDVNGCTVSNQANILEPDSPDLDNDGIGDDCDDDIDGDGIANNSDNCAQTPLGTEVDAAGCAQFSLPSNNFSVQATDETCASSNNGSILITASENLDYIVTLKYGSNNVDKAFRTFVTFQDLEAGAYEICITVAGQSDFERCYNIQIAQPESLDIDAKVDASGKSITLIMKGGDNYTIDINGTLYHTTAEEITLPLSQTENNVSVKTEKDCQGTYKELFLMDVSDISVYPNPVLGDEVSVLIPNMVDKDVLLVLYANDGRKVLQQVEKTNNGPIILNVNGLTSGIYTLKIEAVNKTYSRRIIIK
jgi:hypothetical protein